jgi:hypothetical protein
MQIHIFNRMDSQVEKFFDEQGKGYRPPQGPRL